MTPEKFKLNIINGEYIYFRKQFELSLNLTDRQFLNLIKVIKDFEDTLVIEKERP